MNRRILKKLLLASPLMLAAFLYVGNYMRLSMQGCYEPGTIGPSGVKWYVWAPKGFMTDFKWNKRLTRAYQPLLLLDSQLWHRSEDAYDGKYPIHEVSAGEYLRTVRRGSPPSP